ELATGDLRRVRRPLDDPHGGRIEVEGQTDRQSRIRCRHGNSPPAAPAALAQRSFPGLGSCAPGSPRASGETPGATVVSVPMHAEAQVCPDGATTVSISRRYPA